MQLITVIGTVALLSTSAIASPEEVRKSSPEGRYHIQRQAENGSGPSTSVAKASSSVTVENVVATEPAAYTTDYITLQSGDTAAYGSAFTTIYYDLPASTTEKPPAASVSNGNSSSHRHHHTHKHHISLTSSNACPTQVTSYITVTASTTSFVTLSQWYNSSTVAYNLSSSTQVPSKGYPSSSTNSTSAATMSSGSASASLSSAPASSAPGTKTLGSTTPVSSPSATPDSSSTANSGAFASVISTSGATNSSTSVSHHHHTRQRVTRTRHQHHTASHSPSQSASSSLTTSVSISAIPISVASGSGLHPTITISQTATLTGSASVPTGTASKGIVHCGVHGLPDGDYFLGTYYENSPDVPVTPLGCWELCAADNVVMNGLGCMSWEYWYEYIQGDQGAPRCSLFGAPVAYSLDTVRNDVANVWYDLACGNPTV